MTTREDRETPQQRQVAIAGVVLGIALLLGYGIYRAATGEAVIPKKVVSDVVTMRLVQPPPPPPPPPPRPKMEEQPKEREMINRPQPLENVPPPPNTNNAAPPGPLALDTLGQGAPDAFGLAGHPGGSDILGGGGGGGAQGSAYGWYASLVEGRIQEMLHHDRRLRGLRYEVAVAVHLGPDGKPQGVELIDPTGKADIDQPVTQDLQTVLKLPQPPQGMPEPIIIHVRSY
jgi:outer membrane biosynthesis protein TonB